MKVENLRLEFVGEERGRCAKCKKTGKTHVYKVIELMEGYVKSEVGSVAYCPVCDMDRCVGGAVEVPGPWPGTWP